VDELLENLNRPISPSGRFQLVKPHELVSPAKCVICGRNPNTDTQEEFLTGTSEDRESFVDGNLVFEFYGTVYYCVTCTLEMAALFKALNPEQTRQLIEAVTQLIAQRDDLSQRLQLAEASNDTLMAQLLYLRSGDYNILPSGSIPVITNDETSQVPANEGPASVGLAESDGTGISEEPEPISNVGESEISQPVPEQGPDDISEFTAGLNIPDGNNNAGSASSSSI
jgi:hypothetical protein